MPVSEYTQHSFLRGMLMKLCEIKSALLQLMKIIISAEKAAFSLDEKKMYALMYLPTTKEAFYNDKSQANRNVLKDLSPKIFGYLTDRRYAGNILECDLFIKEHEASWDGENYESETLDPYMSADKIMIDGEEQRLETNINVNDIKIYFNCAFPTILEHLEKIGLVTKEAIYLANNSSNDLSDSNLSNSSDEESNSSIGNADSDNDELNDLSIKDVQSNSDTNNSDAFVYQINIAKLDHFYAEIDDQKKKNEYRDTIKALLIAYRENASREYQLKNNKITVIEEISEQKSTSPLSSSP